MPGPDKRPVQLDLTADELRFILKLAEQNDSTASYGSRLGSVRMRATVLNKLYTKKDALDGEVEDDEGDTEEAENGSRGSI